jgi:hypothetical protein
MSGTDILKAGMRNSIRPGEPISYDRTASPHLVVKTLGRSGKPFNKLDCRGGRKRETKIESVK